MQVVSDSNPPPKSQTLPEGEPLRVNDWSEIGAWMLAALAFGVGVFLLLVPASKPPRFDGPFRYILGLVWIGFGVLMASAARSGVIVEEAGIRIQKLAGSSYWSWHEISSFELRRGLVRPGLQIKLRDGRVIRAVGLAGRNSTEWHRAEEMLAELNRRAAVVNST